MVVLGGVDLIEGEPLDDAADGHDYEDDVQEECMDGHEHLFAGLCSNAESLNWY